MNKICVFLSLFLFISCYDDKGNYDYDIVNKIDVEMDAEYSIRLQDTVFEIHPRLSQTLLDNHENLEFAWLYSSVNENFYGLAKTRKEPLDTIGREDYLAFKIDPDAKDLKYNHYFRFNVYDKTTGIEYPYNTKLTIVKPYHGSWMVLHRQDGVTKLGSVEYIGDKMEVCNDAYFRETGLHLQGNPLCLGSNYMFLDIYGTSPYYNNVFLVITDISTEAGIYCQWDKFRKVKNFADMIAPSYRGSFDYKNVKCFDAIANAYGGVCIAGGSMYQMPTAMKFYKAPIDDAVTGPVDISHGTKVGFLSVFYDKAGRRFLFYYNTKSGADWHSNIFSEEKDNPTDRRLSLIPNRDMNIKTTDPNNLSADKEVLYVGAGYNYDATRNNNVMCYGFARSESKDSCYVYEFRSYGLGNSSQASFSGFYPIKTPEGLNSESCFASSQAYNGILFYAAGDKVYRLDFMQDGGKATAIYTHPGGKAKVMKFAYKGNIGSELDYKLYGYNLNRSLGVVFEMQDGTSELVVLNLAITGKVDNDDEVWPSTQVHKGFGDVADILFL